MQQNNPNLSSFTNNELMDELLSRLNKYEETISRIKNQQARVRIMLLGTEESDGGMVINEGETMHIQSTGEFTIKVDEITYTSE